MDEEDDGLPIAVIAGAVGGGVVVLLLVVVAVVFGKKARTHKPHTCARSQARAPSMPD